MAEFKSRNFIIKLLLFTSLFLTYTQARTFTMKDINVYREKVRQMFNFAYDSYMKYAYPYDELRPISCDGMDTWGSFSLTLIDTLDTLIVMGNYSEFRRVSKLIIDRVDFNMNINVSVFETNIRVVGGLLSAHLLSHKVGLENLDPGWPCEGPLLRLAENVARRLLPAFQTRTGMPYGTVNLRYGVPSGETPVTCTAGISTYIVEFGTLSRLLGDPVFEDTAMKALWALWNLRSPVGLVGNHINVEEGRWTALDAGIGAGVDSYYEYLVKGAILFQKTELMEMFKEYYKLISKYMNRDDWFMWVSMGSGQVTMPVFQSLESYWPGLLSLVGEIEQAQKSLYNYYGIWRQYGFIPEFYDIPHGQANAKREGYPLRPELVESVMYLYRATNDPHLFHIGADILESIECSAKTGCGYATVKNVQDHKIEDRMESFFLAETLKYLYLLFDPKNFIHNMGNSGTVIKTSHGECVIDAGGYVFNTEAHPIDAAAVYCCSKQKKDTDSFINSLKDSLDLYSTLGITDGDYLKPFKQYKMDHKPKKERKYAADDNASKDSSTASMPSQQTVILTESVENIEEISRTVDITVEVSSSDKDDSDSENPTVISNIQNLDSDDSNAMKTSSIFGSFVAKPISKESCPSAVDDCLEVKSTEEHKDNNPSQIQNEVKSEEITSSSQQEDGSTTTVQQSIVLEEVENDPGVAAVSQDGWKNGATYWHMVSADNTIEPKPKASANTTNNSSSQQLRSELAAVNESMIAVYTNLVCQAQSFVSRLSLMGEMFHV